MEGIIDTVFSIAMSTFNAVEPIAFSIAMFIIMIGLIVAIHEGGHFLIGRLCGIRILEYCIGFGKKPIFQKKVGKDQTLITIRLFPIGGFVKPLQEPREGDTPERKFWDSLPESEKNRALERVPRWKRALMVAGGPFANFVLAFAVLFGAYTMVGEKVYQPLVSDIVPGSVFEKAGMKIGDIVLEINDKPITSASQAQEMMIYQYINGGDLKVKSTSGEATVKFTGKDLGEFKDPGSKMGFYISGKLGDVKVESITAGSAAEKAGILPNDIIKSIDGVKMQNINRIINHIGYTENEKVSILIDRNGKELVFDVAPIFNRDMNRKLVGVGMTIDSFMEPIVIRKSVGEAIVSSYDKMISSTMLQVIAIKKLVVGDLSYKNLSSPIAMADYSGLTAKQGVFQYLTYIAIISIAIGIFNLLPIPVLDGGHLLILAVEGLRQKDLSERTMYNLQRLGLAMIMSVFVVALINDVLKYVF